MNSTIETSSSRRFSIGAPKHQWEREIANFSRSARVIHGLRPARAEAWRADDFFKITNYDTIHADLDLISRWAPARSVKRITSPYAIVLTVIGLRASAAPPP